MTAPVPRIGERASWDRVLSALDSRGLVTRLRGDSRLEFRCPCHDDSRPSATADYEPGDPGKTLLCCHSTGCEAYRNGSSIAAALGLTAADLFDGPPPRDGIARRSIRPRPAPQPARKAKASEPACPEHDADWRRIDRHAVTVTRYAYVGAGGELLARVIRKDCTTCGGKDVRPDRSGWAEADRVLYRLPEVLAAVRDGQTVYVVEGEKCADALAGLGYVATTNPFGAGKWLPHHTTALAGAARVVVIADNDRDGYAHVAFVAAELGAADPPVSAVEVVRAAVDTPKADVVDHLAAGGTVETLAAVPAASLAPPEAEVADISSHRGGSGRGRKPPRDDDDQGDDDDGGEPDPPGGAELVEGSPGWAYLPPDGDFPGAVLKLTGAGKRRGWTHVVSWAPDVRARLVTAADDGQATGRHYELKIGDDTAIVSNADLRTGEAWDKFPDATGLGAKPVREVAHNIVAGHARNLPRTLAATRTGWHGQDDSRFYLYPDGRTFPDGRPVRLIGAPSRLTLAASPLDVTATRDQLRQALDQIREHGRAPATFGLAAGARSLAQSLVPVRATFALVGKQNAGKSCAAAHGRGLLLTRRPDPFPYVPTKGFGSTRTDLEFAVNFEADMPQVIEDLALSGDAPAAEVREAVGKLEALIRPVANDDEIRGRRTRDLLPAPANYVRSIPVVTAQALPAGMQSSLYRRAVVLYLREGDVDTAWYAPESLGGGGGGSLLAAPLRTLGDLIIARLYEHGDDLERVLTGYGADAYRLLAPAMDAALPGWLAFGDGTTGIVRSAAGMLAGLAMVAEVVEGVEFAELAEPVLGPLAVSLAEQASKMADRQAAADSLADAVSRVVTAALVNRRAHICGKDGRAAPLVPGLAPSEQGLRDISAHLAAVPEYEGQGVPLYWLPDRGGVGVRGAALHSLLGTSGDPRAAGLTPRSLPEALLRDAASIRNTTQKGRSATHLVDGIGWLIVLRPEVVTGEFEPQPETPYRVTPANDKNDKNDKDAGQSVADDLQVRDGEKNDKDAGQRHDEPAELAEPAEPTETPTSAPIVPIDRRQETATKPGFVMATDRFAAPAVVADADGGYLARPDRVEAVALPAPLRDLCDAVEWACKLKLGVACSAGMPDDAVLVILPGLAAGLGLPASAPDRGSKAAREHPALASLRASGWNVGELASWMRVWRQGGRTVRVWLPGWDDFGTCPMWAEDGVPAVTLAYRLGLFAEHLGISWRFTGGVTGIDLAGTFPRRRMRLAAADPPPPAKVAAIEPDFHWSRKPLSDEAAAGWLHCYDANAMYLTAYGQAVVNLGGWRQVEAPEFDPKVPGYWLLPELPEPGDRLLPDMANPTGRDAGGRPGGWLTTPTLARMAELGCEIRPRTGWLPDGDYGRWYEPFYGRLRDARAMLSASADPDLAAVLAAVKFVWHQTHGMFTVKSQGAQFRPDHRHAVMAMARAGLSRRLGKIADAERRWPLAVATDNVAYASADPDPRASCPAGLRLGSGLGEFKVAGTLPMAEAVPLLGKGRGADVTRLFDAAAEWRETHDGA